MSSSIPLTLLGLLIIGYFVLYIGGRKYLETFESESKNIPAGDKKESRTPVYFKPENPYTTYPIMDLDDYEHSLIFQNENSREASRKEISDAMSRYPLDWSVQPPSSQTFQEYKTAYVDASQKQATAPSETPYTAIDGSDMAPSDLQKLKDEEDKILKTYKPESSKGLLQYNLDDVKTLIDRIYDKKGLIPTIEKSEKQGPNVYEIVEVKKKNEPIVWEDDYERMTERDKMDKRGEQVIEVPQTVNDLSAGLDPFFEPRTSTRYNRNDYTKWTPGLERSFAPTFPIKEWY